jgi:heterodisulfide reductase subunit B
VNHKLKHNEELRDGVNEVLKEIDMEYKGSIEVYHLAELLYDPKIVGVKKIRDSVTNPLTGTRIAVHYGCHLMKPRKERHFGTTEHPVWIEEMVAALGAEIKEKFGVSYDLPVLHYNELLGLAQGMTPQELALDLHAISCEPFLQKIL